ncbi:MAG TPA: GlsB/YeaQ/YmgE family stress response membrane protein [Polyangiaceae bacterium]
MAQRLARTRHFPADRRECAWHETCSSEHEETVMHFIAFLVFGFVIGLIARAIMPGRQKLGILFTSLLGMAGSLLGGFLGILIFGGRPGEPIAAGWIGSIIGALIVLGIAASTRRTSHI